MPTIGAFTGTTNLAINIEGTSRLAQDGIRIGGDTNLYSSAANVLKQMIHFVFTADFRHLGTNLGFYNVATVGLQLVLLPQLFVVNTSIANDSATYGGYTGGQIAAALIAVGILT